MVEPLEMLQCRQLLASSVSLFLHQNSLSLSSLIAFVPAHVIPSHAGTRWHQSSHQTLSNQATYETIDVLILM